MARFRDLFETEACGRCGGSGRYSFNLLHGSVCYGCGGTGYVYTKRGSAAKAAYEAAYRKTKLAGEIVPGEKIVAEHNGRKAVVTVESSEPDPLNVGQDRWNLRLVYPNRIGLGGIGTFRSSEVEIATSVEEKRAAFDSIRGLPGVIAAEYPS